MSNLHIMEITFHAILTPKQICKSSLRAYQDIIHTRDGPGKEGSPHAKGGWMNLWGLTSDLLHVEEPLLT